MTLVPSALLTYNFKPTFMGFHFSLFYSFYCPCGAGSGGQALLSFRPMPYCWVPSLAFVYFKGDLRCMCHPEILQDVSKIYVMFSESISYSEEDGTLYLGSRLPHGGEDSCSVPLPPFLLVWLYVRLSFPWWILGPACHWLHWAAPELTAGRDQSHTPPYELGVFDEVPPAATVPGLLMESPQP